MSLTRTRRWLKRLWLRYVFYLREHVFLAISLTLSALWVVVWLAINVLPSLIVPLLELIVAF